MIRLDGKSLKELGLILLPDHQNPVLPPTEDKTINTPGKHGLYSFPAEFGPRNFNIPVLIDKDSRLGVQQIVRNLTAFLLDSYGRPRKIELRFDYEPEKYYTVRFSGQADISRFRWLGNFNLTFVADDPYAYAPSTAYDQEPVQYDSGVQYDSWVMYENTEQVTWTNSRQYSGVHNYSYYVTPFSFMIEGKVINPRITNLTTGKFMIINVALKSDERLYIDSKRQQAWRVKITEDEHFWLAPDFLMVDYKEWDKANLFNEVNGKFLELVEGDNGLLFEGGLPNATIYFNWEHKFM